ncbi:hypothetical protein ACIA5H_37125 [Nocardia sp. NPDC051900]|uniref:zinc finger domain-containing protein n=1 Tax=Nocardia sp. NPDC051900 TaxID=3364326 RepID=UPI0037BE1D55
MTDPQPTQIIRLRPGERRLGQNEAAEQQHAYATAPCPPPDEGGCGAAIGEPCMRTAVDGTRYETRLAHPKRIRAAVRQQEASADD